VKRILYLGASALPILLILGTMLMAGLWVFPPIRLSLLELAGDSAHFFSSAGINDPDDKVAARACYFQVKNDPYELTPALLKSLAKRPDVAIACLEHFPGRPATEGPSDAESEEIAEEMHPAKINLGNPTLVQSQEILATRLGEHWMKGLRNNRAEDCSVVVPAKTALEYARVDSSHGFLSCAVSADNPEIRACCVDALGGEEAFAELLGQTNTTPLRHVAENFMSLATHSFPEIGHAALIKQQMTASGEEASSEDPSGADAAPEELADLDAIEKIKIPDERFGELQHEVQDWVVGLGCALHLEQPTSSRVIETFVPLIESKQCAPTSPPSTGYFGAMNWSALCQGLYHYHRTDLSQTPRQAICTSLERTIVAQTITASRMNLWAAQGAARKEAGADIVAGAPFADIPKHQNPSRRHTANPGAGRQSSRMLGAFFRTLVSR